MKKCKYILFFIVFSYCFDFYSYSQPGPTIFKGDFNNGIIVSRFTPNAWQAYAPSNPVHGEHRWRLDSTFVRQGKYSMRVELRPGDTTNASSDRAELIGMMDTLGKKIFENVSDDSVKYYAFSVRLDSNWVSPGEGSVSDGGSHGNIIQLHKVSVGDKDTSGPAFSLQVTNAFYTSLHVGNIKSPEDIRFELSDNKLNKGEWIDFVIKIKYSIDSAGEITIWRRNENETIFTPVLHVTDINTLLYHVTNNIKTAFNHQWHTGYYRTRQSVDGTGVTNILWLDGFTIAKTASAAQYNAFDSVVAVLPGDGESCFPPIISDSANNVDCNGARTGSIFLSSYINLNNDTIRWTGPDGFLSSAAHITHLPAGAYTYTIIKPQGCSATKTIIINEPPKLLASANYPNILCKGGTTLVTISATGGVLPYKGINTYTKRAGPFSFIVSDKNKCADTAIGTITEPSLLMASAVADSLIKCFGGTTTIWVSATGGTSPYKDTGHFVAGLGDYSFPISDSKGCKDTIAFSLKNQPRELFLARHDETMVSCRGGNDGTIRLVVNGGTSPYKYSFNGGNSFQIDSVKTGLAAKKYGIKYMDSNGCLNPTNIKIKITQPNFALSSTICFNPTSLILHVVGKGGTPLYKYSLDGITYRGGNTIDGGRDFLHIGAGTTQTIFVVDDNNCLTSQTIKTNSIPPCPPFPLYKEVNTISTSEYLRVHVSPNPAQSAFHLLTVGMINKRVEIRVVDIYGKLHYSAIVTANKDYWFGGDIPPGVYILHAIQGNMNISIKVVKL